MTYKNDLSGRKVECAQKYNFAQMLGERRISHNLSDFPNNMNRYFSSIGHSLASKLPNSSKNCLTLVRSFSTL